MKWVFETIAEGQFNVEQNGRRQKKGIKCCKSNFWNLLRNPIYCGRIYLAGYKDEVSKHVKGMHQPIISEALFYQVQDGSIHSEKLTFDGFHYRTARLNEAVALI